LSSAGADATGSQRRAERAMNVILTEHESDLLRGLLRDHLPDLRREVARTERRDLRHMLVERQELIERLLERLESSAA
jgi:hypothetical protein